MKSALIGISALLLVSCTSLEPGTPSPAEQGLTAGYETFREQAPENPSDFIGIIAAGIAAVTAGGVVTARAYKKQKDAEKQLAAAQGKVV